MTGVKHVLILAALAGATLQPPAATAPPAVPATLAVPPGFTVSVFASGLTGARLMAVSPEGVLLVARRPRNEVVALPVRDGTAQPQVVLGNLTNANQFCKLVHPKSLTVGSGVLRFRPVRKAPKPEKPP